MKILIITLHSLHNPGSILQAYALQTFLMENGYDVQIIDYRPQYISAEGNRWKALMKKIIYCNYMKNRALKFDSFMKNNIKLTSKRYLSFEELEACPPNADCYITGSDQLWNSSYECGKDKAFYLGFAQEGCKIAYAVSAGKSNIPPHEMDWICNHIQDFYWISVREESLKERLEQRAIPNVSYVCDPVLLLEKSKYLALANKPKLGKYIAVYLVDKSKLLDALLLALKEKYGYKIVLIGGMTKRCNCDLHIKDTGPNDFLGLLHGAEFIVASSFHATVFAHIFQKDFAIILPEYNHARIEQFLSVANTSDRIVQELNDIPRVLNHIHYENPSGRIDKFVADSKEIFLRILNEINNETTCRQA